MIMVMGAIGWSTREEIVNISTRTDQLYGSQAECDAGEPALEVHRAERASSYAY